jgi:hypothetical protein
MDELKALLQEQNQQGIAAMTASINSLIKDTRNSTPANPHPELPPDNHSLASTPEGPLNDNLLPFHVICSDSLLPRHPRFLLTQVTAMTAKAETPLF